MRSNMNYEYVDTADEAEASLEKVISQFGLVSLGDFKLSDELYDLFYQSYRDDWNNDGINRFHRCLMAYKAGFLVGQQNANVTPMDTDDEAMFGPLYVRDINGAFVPLREQVQTQRPERYVLVGPAQVPVSVNVLKGLRNKP